MEEGAIKDEAQRADLDRGCSCAFNVGTLEAPLWCRLYRPGRSAMSSQPPYWNDRFLAIARNAPNFAAETLQMGGIH